MESPPVPICSPVNTTRNVAMGMASYFTDVKGLQLGNDPVDFLMINVPPVCNYRCRKCFTDAEKRRGEHNLTLDEWRRVITEASELGAKNVSILGEGEPLIHKDLRPIVEYIHAQGMVPMLATNARHLSPGMTDFLYDHGATVGFSLDTLDATEYEDFCGGNADFSIVMNNIAYARRRFAEAIRIDGMFKIYRLLLHMTVTPQNYNRFKQLMEFCGDDIFFDAQPLANVGVAEDHVNDFRGTDTYEHFQRHGHVEYPPMVLSRTPDGRPVCCLFYFGFAINHSGDVMFDTHAIGPRGILGNIRDSSLSELILPIRALRERFLREFPTVGYCPVRDDSYKQFLAFLKQQT